MKTTYIEAKKVAETGDFDKAWEIAQQDEGLRSGVTKEQWVEFVTNAIQSEREQDAVLNAWISD